MSAPVAGANPEPIHVTANITRTSDTRSRLALCLLLAGSRSPLDRTPMQIFGSIIVWMLFQTATEHYHRHGTVKAGCRRRGTPLNLFIALPQPLAPAPGRRHGRTWLPGLDLSMRRPPDSVCR